MDSGETAYPPPTVAAISTTMDSGGIGNHYDRTAPQYVAAFVDDGDTGFHKSHNVGCGYHDARETVEIAVSQSAKPRKLNDIS